MVCVVFPPWPAAFFKMQTWVVIAKLLKNLSGTHSGVGLGGNWILLAAWLLENPRPGLVCGPRASSMLASGQWEPEGQRGPVTTWPSLSPSKSQRPTWPGVPEISLYTPHRRRKDLLLFRVFLKNTFSP